MFNEEKIIERKDYNGLEFLCMNGLSLDHNLRFLPGLNHILVNNIDGDICDLGAWKGTLSFLYAIALKKINSNKKIYLFDTFDGHPIEQKINIDFNWNVDEKNYQNVNIDDIIKTFQTIEFSNYEIVKGKIQETIINYNFNISFASTDFNHYEPTKIALEYCKNHLHNNGIIFEDDYDHIEGIIKVYNETNWLEKINKSNEFFKKIYLIV
jgi:hypothetical protein